MRVAHILERGEYDKKGEPVESAVPAWLGNCSGGCPEKPYGSGTMAWSSASSSHPCHGKPLLATLFRYGTGQDVRRFRVQGEQPSHPALLDWLALMFIESGWDVKNFRN